MEYDIYNYLLISFENIINFSKNEAPDYEYIILHIYSCLLGQTVFLVGYIIIINYNLIIFSENFTI